MGRRGFIFIAILLLVVSILFVGSISAKDSDSSKIERKVLEKANEEGKARVIVMLKDGKKSRAIRNNLVESVGKSKVTHEFNSINSFSASLTGEEIAELVGNDNVEKIIYDRPLSISLQDSVPLINGTNAWKLQDSGVNLTGKGQTICIIDTGIDYTHPDLGNCTPLRRTLNGTVENISAIENSPHPYTNYYDYTWNITKPGYSQIAVHFVNISTEYYYDYVEIVDSENKIVAVYSGSKLDIWSPAVSGDTIYVRLKTDELVTGYGFYIDQVINGTTNTTYDWSNCSKVIGGWDIRNGDPDPKDDQGHGTHVAGIAAANGVAKGVAPDAKIIAIKALSSGGGTGTTSDVVAGIEWCINRSEEFNISVISMSIGGGNSSAYCDENDTLSSTAINAATAKNISVVVAAGNDGWTDKISYPACIQNAIPVGRINKDDTTIVGNRNNLVQLFAPGGSINSTQNGGGYTIMSGTSMSTPHVAGAFAIINQFLRLEGKTKTPQEIESVLNATGRIIPDSGSGLNFSRINIHDAILASDIKNPEVALISPSDNYANNSAAELNITFRCNATDFSLKNMTLYVWNTSGVYYQNYVNASGSSASLEKNLTGIPQGEYFWNCLAYDNNGNSAFSSSNNSLVYDLTTPNITLLGPAEGYSATGTTTVSFDFNVSDEINLKNCSLILDGVLTADNSSSISKISTNSISSSLSAGNYTWSINCTDGAGNTGNSSSRTLEIIAETVVPSSGGGGGGGGGDVPVTYSASESDLLSGYTKALGKGDKIKFKDRNTENHTITLETVGSNFVKVIVRSTPVNISLSVGEEKKISLVSGDYYDLLVRLDSVAGTKANVTIKEIYEAIKTAEIVKPAGEEAIETPTGSKNIVSIQEESPQPTVSNDRVIYIAVLAIVAVLTVTGVLILLRHLFDESLAKKMTHKINARQIS